MNLIRDSLKDRRKVSDGFNSIELVTHHNNERRASCSSGRLHGVSRGTRVSIIAFTAQYHAVKIVFTKQK